ncbi:MAG: glycosyltransferase family 4 protein, partial [Candidatus Glassbacteria bacterium]
HRECFPVGPGWFERILTLAGRKYIYDFDDAIYLPNVARPNRLFGRLKCPGKVASIVRRSHLTIAGNRYLAEFARNAGAGRVVVLPTVVDTDRFRPPEKESTAGKLVIGWIGSPTTIEFLERFREVFDRVAERTGAAVTFRVVGGQLARPLPASVECVPWKLETEVEELHRFDVGIMPMPDNEWTRGKCAFKAIEYMAVGIPAVCSPVGINAELIEDGVNGFLADDSGAWTEILVRLAEDPGLRARIGLAGRKTVEERYSLRVALPQLTAAILEALD